MYILNRYKYYISIYGEKTSFDSKKKRISFDNFVPKIVNGNFNYSENFQIPLSKKRN